VPYPGTYYSDHFSEYANITHLHTDNYDEYYPLHPIFLNDGMDEYETRNLFYKNMIKLTKISSHLKDKYLFDRIDRINQYFVSNNILTRF